MDFTGFTYNGRHSLEFGIYRVSDGSRYQETLIPTFSDYTTDIQGSDGRFYWGSDKKEKNISINIAFDSVTEKQLREMRKWLAADGVSQIIFDELPYKYYTGKINGEPQISYVCFSEIKNGKMQRVYKGEGTLNFVCYFPYARSVAKFIDAFYDCTNIEEWENSSGLIENDASYNSLIKGENQIKYYNPGDLSTDWKITFRKENTGFQKTTFSLNNTNDYFSVAVYSRENSESVFVGELEQLIYDTPGLIEIDTKKRMITFIDEKDGTKIPALFLLKEGDFFKLPVTSTPDEGIMTISPSIEPVDGVRAELIYDYLYY